MRLLVETAMAMAMVIVGQELGPAKLGGVSGECAPPRHDRVTRIR